MTEALFDVRDRERVRDHVLAIASSDPRVISGAEVGSLALGGGDRWSDLDLTFAVADGVPVDDVLEDWSGRIVEELDAVHLFDLPSAFEPAIVRSLDPAELRRALAAAVEALLQETELVSEVAAQVEPQLRQLVAETASSPSRTARS